MHLTISEASSFIGVSPSTLRRYERQGLIQPKRTVGGHRRYLIADLRTFIGDAPEKEYTIAYARVSSHDQKDDLGRQIQRLESYCKQSGDDYIVLDDLGSGLSAPSKLGIFRGCNSLLGKWWSRHTQNRVLGLVGRPPGLSVNRATCGP